MHPKLNIDINISFLQSSPYIAKQSAILLFTCNKCLHFSIAYFYLYCISFKKKTCIEMTTAAKICSPFSHSVYHSDSLTSYLQLTSSTPQIIITTRMSSSDDVIRAVEGCGVMLTPYTLSTPSNLWVPVVYILAKYRWLPGNLTRYKCNADTEIKKCHESQEKTCLTWLC